MGLLCHGQDPSKPLDSVLFVINRGEYAAAKKILNKTDLKAISNDRKAFYYLALSKILLNEENNLEAYKSLLKAKKYNAKEKNITAFKTNQLLIEISVKLADRRIDVNDLREENCDIANKLNDPVLKINCLQTYLEELVNQEKDKEALQIAYKQKSIAIKNNLIPELEGIETNIGTTHYFMKHKDSSTYYYTRALERRRAKKDTVSIIDHLNNYARIQAQTGDLNGALNSLNEAEELLVKKPDLAILITILKFKSEIHDELGNDDLALDLLTNHNILKDSLQSTLLAVEIADLQSKYKVTEKEKENAELTAKNSENQKQIYLLLFLLTVAGAIAAISIINKNRNEKLLIAQTEAQHLKDMNLLKQQELLSIDAMIAGQERERTRISRELHDDLGSNLTTIRIYLETAQEKSRDTALNSLIENAHKLLTDIYTKVRTISHINSSSVLGEGNLIEAISTLTKRINDTGRLDIEFVHHNMSRTLSNNVALSLFRTIQELINNILKHANATEATVNITGYHKHIDITIEDNGKGFNKVTQQYNMGLNTINSRILALKGSIAIDTAIGKGTTINIEIPLT